MTRTQTDAGRFAIPVELTHFVGRQHELEALRSLVGSARLLTLTGAGGSGKSRLALELVPQLAEAAPDGVAWVELAPLAEGGLVPAAVLRSLGVPAEGAGATLETVVGVIRERALVLVLDNCEHLVETCAQLADALLRACPDLRILATSREALGVAGERAWLVPPLGLPAADATLEALAASDAVQLFTDRARDVLPDFTLTAANARAVADICTRLDGIPLAIELAAARVRHMTPDQIRQRLGDAFALLTTGARTALPRHRTLRATLDWSHDLLRAEGRVVLRRVSVFRGGFVLDMVEQVAAGDGIAVGDVVDLIGVLADRSLIVVREQNGVARYHLLETMRQYAAQKLAEAGETERVQGRFADALVELVTRVEPAFTTTARRVAFAQLEPELDNIREVLAWTRAHRPEQHVRLVGQLWWFWFSTRHWVEAGRWIDEALALPAAASPTPERAALLFAAGALAALRARVAEARARLEEAVSLAGALELSRLEAYALNYLSMTYAASLAPEGRAYAARAEQWFRAHDDAYGLRLALLLGGMMERGAGHIDVATQMMEEAVRIARRFGQDRELAIALQTLGTMLLEYVDADRAEPILRESLEALRRDPSFLFISRGIEYHADTVGGRDPLRAARMLGIGEGVRRSIGAQRFPHDEAFYARLQARLRERLGDAAFERAFADGLAVEPASAIDQVLADRVEATEPGVAAAAAVVAPVAPAPPSTATADLEVRALGAFAVRVQGAAVESWPYAKPKELLAFLLQHPEGRTRAEIGEALWPGGSAAQLRNNFHVTMHHLRKTLGHADWIVLENERYRTSPALTVASDAAAFEQEAQRALALDDTAAVEPLRAALRRYRDHYLAGEPFGAWRDEVQDRLRRIFCDVGVRLGALLQEAGDAEGAAAAYEAVVTNEPLHETAHRGLLLALAHAGRRAHALRHYERLRALLEDLELDPEPETEALHERIRRADIRVEPAR